MDLKKGDTSSLMEPYQTLFKIRNLPGIGAIFGTYLQPDIFHEPIEGVDVSKDRLSMQQILKTDTMYLRVQERKYQVVPK